MGETKERTKKAADKAHQVILQYEEAQKRLEEMKQGLNDATVEKDKLDLSVKIETFEKETLAPLEQKKNKLMQDAKKQKNVAVSSMKDRMAAVKKEEEGAEAVAKATIRELEAKTKVKNAKSEKDVKKQQKAKLDKV